MTRPELTPVRFENGLWLGHLQTDSQPKIAVHYRGEPVNDVQVTKAQQGWEVRIPVPVAALSDGVHCFVIVDADTSEKLGDFTIISGAPASDDLRAQVELLRAELDMLKRAFRRTQSNSQ